MYELLAAIDVVGGAGKRGVGHEVHRERGDVSGADYPPYGELRAQLGSTLVESISEQCGRQRCVDDHRITCIAAEIR